MKDFSYITSSHPSFIENLYQDFVKDPSSVDPEMKKFFEGFDFAVSSGLAATNGGAKAMNASGSTTAEKDQAGKPQEGAAKEAGASGANGTATTAAAAPPAIDF